MVELPIKVEDKEILTLGDEMTEALAAMTYWTKTYFYRSDRFWRKVRDVYELPVDKQRVHYNRTDRQIEDPYAEGE